MLVAIRALWRRLRAWWAAQIEPINGDNREGDWSAPEEPDEINDEGVTYVDPPRQ